MAENTIPIALVPKDFDPTRIVYLTNTLDETFEHTHDGNPIKIKAGETVPMTEPVAYLIAKHLATKVLVSKANAIELEARRQTFSERNQEHIEELSQGVGHAEIDELAKSLIKTKPPKVKASA